MEKLEKEETKVIVLIPVYKNELNIFERVSLRQAKNILCSYPISIIAPDTLVLSGFEYQGMHIERFSDEFFKSTETYSRLLLSSFFYERFEEYEYMLIYQLDALIFSDRLLEFCDMGYDYIGAPVVNRDIGKPWNSYHVGNGGLSLRKISSVQRVISKKDEIMNYSEKEIFYSYEDVFYGYCGHRKDVQFVVPSVYIAAKFSVQDDSGHGIRRIPKQGLPFGIHMWPHLNYHLWKPVVESYGHRLPEVCDIDYLDSMENDRERRMYLYSLHYLRHNLYEKRILMKRFNMSETGRYVIWGAGVFGRECEKLLRMFKIKDISFCDIKATGFEKYKGIDIVRPDMSFLNGSYLIIAVKDKNNLKQIKDQIDKMGVVLSECVEFHEIKTHLIEHVGHKIPELAGITAPLVKKL